MLVIQKCYNLPLSTANVAFRNLPCLCHTKKNGLDYFYLIYFNSFETTFLQMKEDKSDLFSRYIPISNSTLTEG